MRRGRHWLLLAAVALALALAAPAVQAVTPSPPGPAASTPGVTPTVIYGKPPGERNPLQGWLAGAAILVTAGAGIFIYRIIRHGL